MSLKHVHIIFIIASMIISVWFGIWASDYYRHEKSVLYFALAALSFTAFAGLILYLRYFINKYRSKLS